MTCVKCTAELPPGAVYCPFCGKKQAPTPRKYRKRANGTGTVYKMAGTRQKPWIAARSGVYIGSYATKREAEDALSRISGKQLKDTYNYTFAEVYEAWSADHFKDISKTAIAQYKVDYNVFADLHPRRFRDLRTPDYQEILDRHAEKSENTTGKYKQLITQMSDWAIKNEIIDTNFASFCKARGRDAKPHVPFTAEEIKKLQADGSETARVVCMLLSTGMRISELFKLPLSDYHGSYVIGGEKTEEGRDRIIPIRPEGRADFEHFAELARQSGAKLLIDGYSGNRSAANFRKRDYARLLTKIGADPQKTPHSARTTYGTRAATEDELNPATLQKVLGHKQFNTTQKYYNLPNASQLVKAVEKSVEGEN